MRPVYWVMKNMITMLINLDFTEENFFITILILVSKTKIIKAKNIPKLAIYDIVATSNTTD